MDIPRPSIARQRRIRRILYLVIGLVAIASVTLGLSRLKPAAPSVDAGTLWFGTVQRGPMMINVRGLGTLVPEEILWVPSVTDGRVVRRLVLPGTPVEANMVIMDLSNPDSSKPRWMRNSSLRLRKPSITA